jgi:PTH1 family peptidyl-tRNA hydrolase
MSVQHVFVGLGNPGSRYAKNRHNAGFMFVDALQAAFPFDPWQTQKKLALSKGRVGAHDVTLLKPLDYMNRSGPPVASFINFYKIPLEQVAVVYDDLALPLGKIRLKKGGGSGGHNGIKSLDQTIGKDYWRLKIGIDHPGDPEDVSPYVLSNFTGSEKRVLEPLLETMVHHLPDFLEGARETFVSRVLQP